MADVDAGRYQARPRDQRDYDALLVRPNIAMAGYLVLPINYYQRQIDLIEPAGILLPAAEAKINLVARADAKSWQVWVIP